MTLLTSRGSKSRLNKIKKSKIHLLEDCYKSITKKRNSGSLSEQSMKVWIMYEQVNKLFGTYLYLANEEIQNNL